MSDLFSETALVVPFELLRMTDVESVGGKNASLGEMISQLPSGVRVPTGFATTAHAFRQFLAFGGLTERINARLDALDTEDVRALAAAGAEIRAMVEAQPFPADLEQAIREAFVRLQGGNPDASFAVRSSATAEDLPDASFAGQQETFLNVVGIEDVLHKMKEVFASLYNDRAISYRVHKGFAHADVALSAGVQRMVRSDLGAAGVMFTIDTESGFEDVVFITPATPGRDGGAGRRQPRRVLCAQTHVGCGQAQRDPSQPGLQTHRDGFRHPGRKSRIGQIGQNHRRADRAAQPLQPDRRRGRAIGPLRGGDRAALRPSHGHRVGAKTAPTVCSTSCKPVQRP